MQAKVVSHDQWLQARTQFLAKEKELTRLRDELARQRRELPVERVSKSYIFENAAGKRSLGELFDGSPQLIVYHFMFGAGWPQGCQSCSFVADQFDNMRPHLLARNINLVAVSHAPWNEIAPFKQRMGWNFPWFSSSATDFNYDYAVSFDAKQVAGSERHYNFGTQHFKGEEAPGISVFAKDASGEVVHTYSTYGRGLDMLLSAYNFIDLTPQGRNEEGLPWPMAWVRHHDKYEHSQAQASCH